MIFRQPVTISSNAESDEQLGVLWKHSDHSLMLGHRR